MKVFVYKLIFLSVKVSKYLKVLITSTLKYSCQTPSTVLTFLIKLPLNFSYGKSYICIASNGL